MPGRLIRAHKRQPCRWGRYHGDAITHLPRAHDTSLKLVLPAAERNPRGGLLGVPSIARDRPKPLRRLRDQLRSQFWRATAGMAAVGHVLMGGAIAGLWMNDLSGWLT